MLPALGGLLGSFLFKQDGGKIGVPALKSSRLERMTGGTREWGDPNDPRNPLSLQFMARNMARKSGGVIKKGKGKGKGKHKKK